jgi:hypothetical protein
MCTENCEIKEPVFTEQVLSFQRRNDQRWFEVPMEAEQNENEHAFKEALRTAVKKKRDETWKSTVIKDCTEEGCECERTDTVLAGPTNPPKARQISRTFEFNHRSNEYKLRLKRAWQTVQGLCVPNDEEHALQDVSFLPDEQLKA